MDIQYYSQGCHLAPNSQQDKFVCETLKFRRNGTFLDIGAGPYQFINNTYCLEKQLDWTGISVDLDFNVQGDWLKHRKTPFIIADALKLDYQDLLTWYKMPAVIDYLSVDLEPPSLTLEALYKIFQSNYMFNVITFETDEYRNTGTREPSQKFLKEKGYILVRETLQDDFYVHSTII